MNEIRHAGQADIHVPEQPGPTRTGLANPSAETTGTSHTNLQRTARIRHLTVPHLGSPQSVYHPLAGLLPYDQNRPTYALGERLFSTSGVDITSDLYREPWLAAAYDHNETHHQRTAARSKRDNSRHDWQVPFHYPLATLSLYEANRLFDSSLERTRDKDDPGDRRQPESAPHQQPQTASPPARLAVGSYAVSYVDAGTQDLLGQAVSQDISRGLLPQVAPEKAMKKIKPCHAAPLPVRRATWDFLLVNPAAPHRQPAAPDEKTNRDATEAETLAQTRIRLGMGRSRGDDADAPRIAAWLLAALDDGDRDLAWYHRAYPEPAVGGNPSKVALRQSLLDQKSEFRQTITNGTIVGRRIVDDNADEILEAMWFCLEHGVQLKNLPKLWGRCFSGNIDRKRSGVTALLTQTKELVEACCDNTTLATGPLQCNPALLQGVMDMQSPTKRLTAGNVRDLKAQFDLHTPEGLKQLHAFANMFFGNGMFQRQDAEHLQAWCAVPGEDALTVLGAVTNMQRRKGMIKKEDFDDLIALSTTTVGHFDLRILVAITRIQNGKGMCDVQNMRDLLAMCSTQNGNVDLDALNAVAKARFQKGVPTKAQFDAIVRRA